MEQINRLFVYGSLRKGFSNPAYNYITQFFSLVSEGKVKGRMYDMGNYPVGIPANDDVFIKGELYEFKNALEFSWAIEQLDAYEGLNPEEGELLLYERAVADVFYNDEVTKAWIYWYVGKVDNQPLIPSGDVFDFFKHKSKL